MYSFGQNNCGQLGLGHTNEVLSPVLNKNIKNFTKLVSGNFSHNTFIMN